MIPFLFSVGHPFVFVLFCFVFSSNLIAHCYAHAYNTIQWQRPLAFVLRLLHPRKRWKGSYRDSLCLYRVLVGCER
ncbi:hypothetical protein HOY80DRAFT_137369 [Tuber brumale]|nr:hypothetical protein HOY80DRAFT_137369 [Tuber brumale]